MKIYAAAQSEVCDTRTKGSNVHLIKKNKKYIYIIR